MTPPNLDKLVPEYGFLRDYVDLYRDRLQASPMMHFGAAIATLSAAVGWRAYLDFGGSQSPCTLYVIITGPSGSGKTTAANVASSIMASASKGALAAGATPPVRRIKVSHVSAKGLITAIGPASAETALRYESEPPPGVLIDWDEIGSLFGDVRDQVKGAGWKGDIRAEMMRMVDGRHGGDQTAMQLPASRCAVSLLGTMTQFELEQRAGMGLIRDGFIGRMLMLPTVGDVKLKAVPEPATPEYLNARAGLVAFIARVAEAREEFGNAFAKMDPAADALWKGWYGTELADIVKRAKIGEVEDAVAVVAGRLQATALKVATICAISRMEPTQRLDQVEIDEVDIMCGIEMFRSVLGYAERLAHVGGELPEDSYGEKVCEFLIAQNGHGPIGKKELLDRVKAASLNRAQRWRVVEELQTEGRVTIRQVSTGGRPRLEVGIVRD